MAYSINMANGRIGLLPRSCLSKCSGLALNTKVLSSYELVFGQDKLAAVSGNYADISYTYEFERFNQGMGFNVYLCHKSGLESKSKLGICSMCKP